MTIFSTAKHAHAAHVHHGHHHAVVAEQLRHYVFPFSPHMRRFCRWVHVSTIRSICQPLFFIFFHHDANFFLRRWESKHAKEDGFPEFSPNDKRFSLSDVHAFFTDSFLLKMESYGIIFVNGRVCVSARQAGQVRCRFDRRIFEGGIVCCLARNLIC